MERIVRDKDGHPTGMVTMPESEYHEMVESNTGICTKCGATRDCCEPDAENYECEECGSCSVFGVEQLLIAGKLEFSAEEKE